MNPFLTYALFGVATGAALGFVGGVFYATYRCVNNT